MTIKALLQMMIAGACVALSGCGGEWRPSADVAGGGERVAQPVVVDTTADLVAFYPQFKRVDLAFGTMPSMSDGSVLMCCAAAFTGKEQKRFDHRNIAGNHVGGGEFHAGYPCRTNTGAFVWAEGKWRFLMGDYEGDVARAADKRGMAFGQMMIIHGGRRVAGHVGGRYVFRALCERRGRLCVVEGRRLQDFDYFVSALQGYGVSEALYLVMGRGWNYSWYRDIGGGARILHPHQHDYSNNWIVFLKGE